MTQLQCPNFRSTNISKTTTESTSTSNSLRPMKSGNTHIRRLLLLPLFGAMMLGCTGSARGQSETDEAESARSQLASESSYGTSAYGSYIGLPEDASAETPDEAASRRYKEKYAETNIADIHLLRADGRRIWYSPWTSEIESGYVNRLYIYDSETDTEQVVSLNKTPLEDDEMYVEDMRERNGIITVIMSERRNSNGWVEGTHVWQYNCDTGAWKALAKECSGAEFNSDATAVRVNYVEILNPDDPTFLQEFRDHYKTVRL